MKLTHMRSDGKSLLAGLFDLQFTTIVTTQMVPSIYTLALLLAGLTTLYLTVWGFFQSWVVGLAWLLVLGPAVFLAVVVTVRVLLEFVLTVFRIAFFLEALGSQIDGIAGQTEELNQAVPRIRFWRSRRSNE